MVPAATTVGGYLQSLPNDRRVAMARVCSMIRRSARGVRASMRFGLAFYELDGPLFAVEPHEKSLVLYLAERDVVKDFKDKIKKYLPTLIALVFISTTVLRANLGDLDPQRMADQTVVCLVGVAAILLYHGVMAVWGIIVRRRDPAQKLRK